MTNNLVKTHEIEEAFKKLQSSIYYENSNLSIREQLAIYMQDSTSSINEKLEQLLKRINSGDQFKNELKNIELLFYPKKIQSKSSTAIPSNFITNNFIDEFTIDRYAIFAKLPIELHIISILWLIKYGYILDKTLKDNCLGNRLIIDKDKETIVSGKSLYKPYMKQYQKWWSNAINKAEQLFEEKSDVSIINFDLQDYYHRVQFDFEEIESVIEIELTKENADFRLNNSYLNKLFINIHIAYKNVLRNNKSLPTNLLDPSLKDNQYPLPIGLLSSPVLGNWYLSEFDSLIENKVSPIYYARYVDDIIIVLKDSIIDNSKLRKIEEPLSDFFKEQGILSETTIFPEEELSNPIHLLIKNKFSSILKPKIEKVEDEEVFIFYSLQSPKYNWLRLQKEKIFIYQFNHKFSPNLLKKFSEEQKERSSEFRFLSDEEDESYEKFDATSFESNFDNIDGNKAKFKLVEDNKFSLSVYLAKLIKRRIQRGSNYKDDEIEKIDKFFQGLYCLKYYIFWEKLFTLYLVSGKKNLFLELRNRIVELISKEDIKEECKKTLENHLENSMRMALGLSPSFFKEKDLLKIGVKKTDDKKKLILFRQSYLLRKHYIYYPIFHLIDEIRTTETSLIDSNLFAGLEFKQFSNDKLRNKYIPFDVKFYDACLFEFLVQLLSKPTRLEDKVFKTWYGKTDFLEPKILLDNAFKLFCILNGKGNTKEYKDTYYKSYAMNSMSNLQLKEIHFPNSPKKTITDQSKKKIQLRLGLINKYVDLKEYESSLLGERVLSPGDIEIYDNILDQVDKINGCDLFVMPELALPHTRIYEYVKYSSTRQKGFISGIEYFNIKNIGFNFVLTCLPINIDGLKDAIPIFRLKNHYSPDEEGWIRGKHMLVPKSKYRYDLFVWNKAYFSTYYCFELANIVHRSAWCSKVDAIFAPLWNPDIHYYNNIAESTSRDLHCYFIQVNTSQYGETRVVRPTDHVRLDKARLKGGTTTDNPVNVIVADIDISGLREFQKVDYPEQKDRNRDKKSFKPTPPDFNKENVRKRINGNHFGKKQE